MRLLTPPLVCREAVELMSDYLDGALSRRVTRRLERHLAACDGCTAYLEQLRAAIELSGRVAPEALDPATLEGLVEIYRHLREEDQ